MQTILMFLKLFWIPLVKFGGLIIAGVLFWFRAKKSGEDAIKQRDLESTLKATQDYDNAKNTISKLSDSKLDKLLSEYTRD